MPHRTPIDLIAYREPLLTILREVVAAPAFSRKQLFKLLKRYRKDDLSFFACDDLVLAYRHYAGSEGLLPFDPAILERLRLKPVRTESGVAVVTVLTKPYPCPGECIFCPNDIRMPKSYLSDEPGAQRAAQNGFDPYLQTYSRLLALHRTGHSTDKIEVIVLGGTWSFYPEPYQIWFVKRIFDALHDFGSETDRHRRLSLVSPPMVVDQIVGLKTKPEMHISGYTLRSDCSCSLHPTQQVLLPERHIVQRSSYHRSELETIAPDLARSHHAQCLCIDLAANDTA